MFKFFSLIYRDLYIFPLIFSRIIISIGLILSLFNHLQYNSLNLCYRERQRTIILSNKRSFGWNLNYKVEELINHFSFFQFKKLRILDPVS